MYLLSNRPLMYPPPTHKQQKTKQKKNMVSGPDKDLNQWVFTPYFFYLMSILLPT